QVVEKVIEQLRPVQGRDLLRDPLEFLDHAVCILPVQFAHQDVLVGEELVERADGDGGAGGDVLAGDGVEPHFHEHTACRGQQRLELAAAAFLDRSAAGDQYVRLVRRAGRVE